MSLHRATLVRSLTHRIAEHSQGAAYVMAGNRPNPALDYPSLGSLAARIFEGILPPAHAAQDLAQMLDYLLYQFPIPVMLVAAILGLSRAQTYALLNKDPILETRYFGRRRLVVLDSLRQFADSLPAERETA